MLKAVWNLSDDADRSDIDLYVCLMPFILILDHILF